MSIEGNVSLMAKKALEEGTSIQSHLFRVFCLIIKNNFQNLVYLKTNTFLVNATPCISLVQETRFFVLFQFLTLEKQQLFCTVKRAVYFFLF